MLVITFYKFIPLIDYQAMRQPCLDKARENELRGSILLAAEGINATIAGEQDKVMAFMTWLKNDPRLSDLQWKESRHHQKPFQRMKVRLKQEIVALKVTDIDPIHHAGDYLDADQWDALITDPDTLVIDTRNDYEVRMGSFTNAIDPKVKHFRDLPEWLDQHLDPAAGKKIAMFCTGGIRCEKSTAYLKQRGFDHVYHLRGGILQYLEDTQNRPHQWHGACFVFDDRVAVNDRLESVGDQYCPQCGTTLTTDDHKSNRGESNLCEICRG
jgi:UPF0176 protein